MNASLQQQKKRKAVIPPASGLVILIGLLPVIFGFGRVTAQSETQSDDTPVERSRESIKSYTKSITIHSVNFEDINRTKPNEDASQYDEMIPNVPTVNDSDFSGKNVQPNLFPIRKLPSKENNENEEDANRKVSGWGWLADDIANKRESKKKDEKVVNDEGESFPGEDPLRLQGREKEKTFFMDSSFEPAKPDSALLRPTRDDKKGDNTRNRDRSADGQYKDRRNPDEGEVRNQTQEKETSDDARGLVMRDPFAPQQEETETRFGDRNWSLGGTGESVFDSRKADRSVDVDRERSRPLSNSSAGILSENQSSRLIGDAESDSSRMSSAWTGYSSDSIFNAGGGYTPQGIGSAGSDSLFSGAGVFGGGSVGSIITPAHSTLGGLPSFSSSSYDASPAGSSLESKRFESDNPTPSALPW